MKRKALFYANINEVWNLFTKWKQPDVNSHWAIISLFSCVTYALPWGLVIPSNHPFQMAMLRHLDTYIGYCCVRCSGFYTGYREINHFWQLNLLTMISHGRFFLVKKTKSTTLKWLWLVFKSGLIVCMTSDRSAQTLISVGMIAKHLELWNLARLFSSQWKEDNDLYCRNSCVKLNFHNKNGMKEKLLFWKKLDVLNMLFCIHNLPKEITESI